MAARLPPSRRAEPTFREQRRQKVEEYLSRKKTFSGVPIQESKAPISSSRTRRAASNKLQDKNLSASPKPEMEDKENANQLSWDQSSTTSEENVILKSSMITLASGTSYNAEDLTSKDEVTEIKSQHVTLSKSFLHIKSIKEKQLIAEKQNLNVSLTKKPVLGTYHGKVIQSKINSFRKAPKSEGEKNSLPNKKIVTSTKPAVKPLSTSRCNVVLKTIKVTNHPNSVKPNGVLPLQSKQSDKTAINSQSSLNKRQSTSAVVPKKGTIQNMGRRGPQPLKAASNNSDRGVVGVKKPVDFCQNAKPGAQAKAVSVLPSMKTGQDSKTMGSRKSVLLKDSAEERRICLAEWRASRGKVMKRPPISVLLETRPKSEEQDFSSAASSLDHVLHIEKVNKTLAECLQLTEQGYGGDKVRAMLQDLIQSAPGAKKLAKYWICWMHLERRGPPEKLFAVYEEAILAGAMPKDELRHMLIDIMKNSESLIKSEDGSAVIESHLEEAEEESKIEPQIEVKEESKIEPQIEVKEESKIEPQIEAEEESKIEPQIEAEEESKEPNSSPEQVQETFKSLSSDQKAEGDDKKAATGNEVIKKEKIEEEIDLKPDGEILPKKNKKHKAKERTKNKGKRETEEQSEDGVKDLAQAVNSPEKNDTTYITRYNPSTTPYLESVKMYHEANDSTAKDLKIITPLRYSLRIREKMSKSSDTPKDSCVSSFEELESKATALLHKQNNDLKEATVEVKE